MHCILYVRVAIQQKVKEHTNCCCIIPIGIESCAGIHSKWGCCCRHPFAVAVPHTTVCEDILDKALLFECHNTIAIDGDLYTKIAEDIHCGILLYITNSQVKFLPQSFNDIINGFPILPKNMQSSTYARTMMPLWKKRQGSFSVCWKLQSSSPFFR